MYIPFKDESGYLTNQWLKNKVFLLKIPDKCPIHKSGPSVTVTIENKTQNKTKKKKKNIYIYIYSCGLYTRAYYIAARVIHKDTF